MHLNHYDPHRYVPHLVRSRIIWLNQNLSSIDGFKAGLSILRLPFTVTGCLGHLKDPQVGLQLCLLDRQVPNRRLVPFKRRKRFTLKQALTTNVSQPRTRSADIRHSLSHSGDLVSPRKRVMYQV